MQNTNETNLAMQANRKNVPSGISGWLNVRCQEHERCMALRAHGIKECFECEVPGGR